MARRRHAAAIALAVILSATCGCGSRGADAPPPYEPESPRGVGFATAAPQQPGGAASATVSEGFVSRLRVGQMYILENGDRVTYQGKGILSPAAPDDPHIDR